MMRNLAGYVKTEGEGEKFTIDKGSRGAKYFGLLTKSPAERTEDPHRMAPWLDPISMMGAQGKDEWRWKQGECGRFIVGIVKD